MKINQSRGFTLIELLVVIAIIGILSSVVLASLNTARSKGADAAVKSNLASIRPQAEIVYDAQVPPGYGTVAFTPGACAATANTLFADTTIGNQVKAGAIAGGGTDIGSANCVSSVTGAGSWAVNAPLKNPVATGGRWCVDSTGVAKEVVPASGDLGFLSGVCK